MNSQWMQSYQRVVEMGSISKAAKTLFVSPQALLQQINLLETEIGITLLERDNQGSRPTIAGEEFYRGAVALQESFTELIARCQRLSSNDAAIRIPFMSSVIAPRFIERTVAEYSELPGALPVNLIPTAERTNTWVNGLENDSYDIVQHYTIDGIVPEGVYFESLGGVPTWCIMRKDSSLASKEVLVPGDLAGKVIAVQALALTRYFQLFLENSRITARMVEIESDRFSLLRACENDCIAFVDEAIAREFPELHIAKLDFDNHVEWGLACREDQRELYAPFFDIARRVATALDGRE